uniref:Uncharacterized protein n=1 Tax=Oryza sativa subsp. japonica TaxID=39947 RepID=Q6ZL59_ORYSJ|nr:hypothetical protein [Oryza sativa Japonica Group]
MASVVPCVLSGDGVSSANPVVVMLCLDESLQHSSASAVAALQTCSNHVGMRASSEHKEDGSSPGSQAGHDARRSTGKVLCLEAAALRLEGDSVVGIRRISDVSALYRGLEASNSTILDIDDQQPRFTHADWLGFALFRD